MARHWPLAVGLVVALIAIWWIAVPPSKDEPSSIVVAPSADMPVLIAGSPAPKPPLSAAVSRPPSAATPPSTSETNSEVKSPETAVDPFPPPKSEGPVDQYKATFQSEPRDSTAQNDETAAQNAFRAPEVPASLFKSALCHQSICRIEVAWTKDRQLAYMASVTRLVFAVGQKTALEATPGPDKNGEYPLTLWVQRGTQLKVPQ